MLDEFDVSPYLQENISLSVRKLTRDIQKVFTKELARFDSAI